MAHGSPLPLYSALPFVAMLLAIAVCPLWIPHWWEHNRNKLLASCALGLPVAALYVVREPRALVRMGEDYLSFMVLRDPCLAVLLLKPQPRVLADASPFRKVYPM